MSNGQGGLFGTGIDPWQALLALIPGQQTGLGEQPAASEGLIPALGQALGYLIPGTQTGLGEVYVPKEWRNQVVYSWSTGTATMYRLSDGRIACQKKNGVWKFWRPAHHIVISRNPRVGTLLRADKKLHRLTTGLKKAVNRK